MAPVPPAALIHRVHSALLRHTGGRLTDDVALMVVRDDLPGCRRSPRTQDCAVPALLPPVMSADVDGTVRPAPSAPPRSVGQINPAGRNGA